VPAPRTPPNLPPPPEHRFGHAETLAATDILRRRLQADGADGQGRPPAAPDQSATDSGQPVPAASGGNGAPSPRREQATESIARRAGALSDEIDFPDFVAGLVHGTFDAVVNATIRQMETFGDLIAAVAKHAHNFTEENVSLNQARDWLVQQHHDDLMLSLESGPTIVPKPVAGLTEDAPRSPAWLGDYGLADQELTPELIEEQLVPAARRRLGRSRLQTLATMVMLGMNRVVVRDGTISARLRFRANAADQTKVDYAVSDDPTKSARWGARGSNTYDLPTTRVSTVGVNVQSDAELKAELFGEVKINFASETLPLDRFVDDARRTLLERNARSTAPAAPAHTPPPAAAQLQPIAPQTATVGPAAPAQPQPR